MDTDLGHTQSVGDEVEDYTMPIPYEVPLIAAKFAVNTDIGDPVEDEIAQSTT